MSYPARPRGLYQVKRASAEKGVEHHGIMDVGNVRGQIGVGNRPAVFHMTYPLLRYEWVGAGLDGWVFVRRIDGVREALGRLAAASGNPDYSVLFNNCEHFANYVATSKRESPQLANALGIAALSVVVLLAVRSGSKAA